MSEQPQPLFIDTGAFFAWVNTRAGRHETAQSVFDALRREAIPYQPLFTSRYVLSELATLTSRKVNHKTAVEVLQTIRRSESFNILPVGEGVFAAACDEFERYDDQQISFVDHTSAVLAREYEIDHIFAFDRDFTTLGLTRVPADIHFPK
ncbi:PIN domain-containing protein [Haladaptatus sp. DYF46]|uniref:type II toxin-antitoxin system VapC family toxin n=1 Tax=Haladaptatus sp. DYF46 TaxID=2886041 RepID=UPI001E568AA9|nr:PIN domain-containing protein [Haladaptatus sp. DYF46]